MRRGVEFAVLAILAAAVVLLVLNHLESDEYPASTVPERLEKLPPWLSTTFIHRCGETDRAYRFEATECRTEVTVTDRDGWYRLFWSGADVYTYDDPALVGGALRNRTAELAGGTWIIRGRLVTEQDSGKGDPIELRYALRRGMFPGMGTPVMERSGTLPAPTRLLWFRYPYPPDRLDDFWWELENADAFEKTNPLACGCGR